MEGGDCLGAQGDQRHCRRHEERQPRRNRGSRDARRRWGRSRRAGCSGAGTTVSRGGRALALVRGHGGVVLRDLEHEPAVVLPLLRAHRLQSLLPPHLQRLGFPDVLVDQLVQHIPAVVVLVVVGVGAFPRPAGVAPRASRALGAASHALAHPIVAIVVVVVVVFVVLGLGPQPIIVLTVEECVALGPPVSCQTGLRRTRSRGQRALARGGGCAGGGVQGSEVDGVPAQGGEPPRALGAKPASRVHLRSLPLLQLRQVNLSKGAVGGHGE